jgi:hypothetical protein
MNQVGGRRATPWGCSSPIFKLGRGIKPSSCQLLKYLKWLHDIDDFHVGVRLPGRVAILP